jgi:hypothetical protein
LASSTNLFLLWVAYEIFGVRFLVFDMESLFSMMFAGAVWFCLLLLVNFTSFFQQLNLSLKCLPLFVLVTTLVPFYFWFEAPFSFK